MSAPSRGPHPWTADEVAKVVIWSGAGAVAVLLAWVGSSNTADVTAQGQWANLAVAGVLVTGMAGTLFMLRGMRRVWAAVERHRPSAPAPVGETPADSVVAVHGLSKFHRPGCALVAGKSVRQVRPTQVSRRGLQPCGVCRP